MFGGLRPGQRLVPPGDQSAVTALAAPREKSNNCGGLWRTAGRSRDSRLPPARLPASNNWPHAVTTTRILNVLPAWPECKDVSGVTCCHTRLVLCISWLRTPLSNDRLAGEVMQKTFKPGVFPAVCAVQPATPGSPRTINNLAGRAKLETKENSRINCFSLQVWF